MKRSTLRIVSPATPCPTLLEGRYRVQTGNGRVLKTFPTYALAHRWLEARARVRAEAQGPDRTIRRFVERLRDAYRENPDLRAFIDAKAEEARILRGQA